MTDAEFAPILEAVIAQTKHEKWREQSNPTHPSYVPGIRESIVMVYRGDRQESVASPVVPSDRQALADAGESVSKVEIADEQLAAHRAEVEARGCRSKDADCRCNSFRCSFGYGVQGIVNNHDCLQCLGYIDANWQTTPKGRGETTEPVDPKAYPSLWTQAKNAAEAAARFAASGFAIVDDVTAEARLAVCRGCESYDAGQKRCRECGCYVDIKARAAAESCPRSKWSATIGG